MFTFEIYHSACGVFFFFKPSLLSYTYTLLVFRLFTFSYSRQEHVPINFYANTPSKVSIKSKFNENYNMVGFFYIPFQLALFYVKTEHLFEEFSY